MLKGLINPFNRKTEKTEDSQNLIKQVSAEKIERPRGFYVSIALDAVAVILAGTTGLFYANYLNYGWYWAWVLLPLLPLAVVSAFSLLLTRRLSRRLGVVALEVLAIFIFFLNLDLVFIISAAAATYGFLAWGEIAGRQEMENSMELKFLKIIRPQINKMITALVLLGVLLYLPQWDAQRSFFSQNGFDQLYTFASGFAGRLYPELNFNSSMEAFIRSFARLQLKADPGFFLLLAPAQDKIITEAAGKLTQSFGQGLGVQFTPQEPLSRVFYDFLLDKLKVWEERFGNQFLFAWAVVVFFLLRGLGALFYWLAAGLSFFLYELALALNWIHVVGESRTHETAEYS